MPYGYEQPTRNWVRYDDESYEPVNEDENIRDKYRGPDQQGWVVAQRDADWRPETYPNTRRGRQGQQEFGTRTQPKGVSSANESPLGPSFAPQKTTTWGQSNPGTQPGGQYGMPSNQQKKPAPLYDKDNSDPQPQYRLTGHAVAFEDEDRKSAGLPGFNSSGMFEGFKSSPMLTTVPQSADNNRVNTAPGFGGSTGKANTDKAKQGTINPTLPSIGTWNLPDVAKWTQQREREDATAALKRYGHQEIPQAGGQQPGQQPAQRLGVQLLAQQTQSNKPTAPQPDQQKTPAPLYDKDNSDPQPQYRLTGHAVAGEEEREGEDKKPIAPHVDNTSREKLRLDKNGVAFIHGAEGFMPKPYEDDAGHCTIGYGHLLHKGTCTKEDHDAYPNGITNNDAVDMFNSKIDEYQNAVRKHVKIDLTQDQYNALVSLVYNIGETTFSKSETLKQINAGNFEAARREWLGFEYTHDPNGNLIKSKGLRNRRERETRLFMGEKR